MRKSVDLFNATVGLTSLVIGGFAIWLSLRFYEKAKEAEKPAALLLERIRTQTDSLQKLTGHWMDRFTISLRVDADVLDWFKTQGPRYQSRLNAVLRSYMTQRRQSSRRAG